MKFVPPKTLAQQGMLCVHRLREGLKEERTACINRIRGLLAEFGLVLPQSPAVLRQHLSSLIEDASNDIAGVACLVLQRAQEHLEGDRGPHWMVRPANCRTPERR
jgi:transposase